MQSLVKRTKRRLLSAHLEDISVLQEVCAELRLSHVVQPRELPPVMLRRVEVRERLQQRRQLLRRQERPDRLERPRVRAQHQHRQVRYVAATGAFRGRTRAFTR